MILCFVGAITALSLWYANSPPLGFQWYPPVPLELTLSVEPGCKSIERQVQLDRERFVLQAIYFTRESIPFSPEEPEKEEFEAKMAVEIPLEDVCFLGGFFPLNVSLLSILSTFLLNKISLLFIVSVMHCYTDGSGVSQLCGHPFCQLPQGNVVPRSFVGFVR